MEENKGYSLEDIQGMLAGTEKLIERLGNEYEARIDLDYTQFMRASSYIILEYIMENRLIILATFEKMLKES